MIQLRIIIKKAIFYIGSFTSGGVFFYILLKLWEKYQSAKDINNFLKDILNFQLHEPNNLTIGKILILFVVLLLGVQLSKIVSNKVISKIVGKTKLNNGTKSAVEKLSYYFFICLAILIALNIAEVPLTIFTLFGGALAIGLGFGSQNILSNFIGGIILQIEQPVRVGDIIEMEGVIGTIEDIGGLRTKIIASNNTHLILPNSYLLDKKLVNWTFHDNVLRCRVEVKIPYEVNNETFKKIILETMEHFEGVKNVPEPRIILEEFGSYSLNYVIFFWVPVLGSMDKLTTEGKFRVLLMEKLLENNIKIPIQTMTIKKDE